MKYGKPITREICKFLVNGMKQKEAAALSGVDESTFYIWMKKPEFFQSVKKAELKCKQRNIDIILSAAKGNKKKPGVWTAAAWWLERTCPEEFGQKWQGELSGKGGKPLMPNARPTVDLSGVSKADLQRLMVISIQPKATNGSNGKMNGHGEHPPVH